MAWIKKRETKRGEPRYDVGYRGPNGKVRHQTFRRKKAAEDFKRTVEADIVRGQWIDPKAGEVLLADYADQWLTMKPRLTARTRDLYESQLRLHIKPDLGSISLSALTSTTVREWHARLYGKPGVGPNTVAKVYRLLHGVMATATKDELVFRNPCNVENGHKEEYDERPVATVPQVFALADAVEPRRRALVLMAGFTGLRLGELLALRRRHLDLLHGRVIVEESTIEDARGQMITKRPKTKAGVRSVTLDPVIRGEIEVHLSRHVLMDTEAHLFTGVRGGQLRRGVWQPEFAKARLRVDGLGSGFHFHDLRHTHATLVTQVGASTREAMRRLGHSTVDAAMVYQHGTDERDREIAELIGRRINDDLATTAVSDRVERDSIARGTRDRSA